VECTLADVERRHRGVVGLVRKDVCPFCRARQAQRSRQQRLLPRSRTPLPRGCGGSLGRSLANRACSRPLLAPLLLGHFGHFHLAFFLDCLPHFPHLSSGSLKLLIWMSYSAHATRSRIAIQRKFLS